MKKTVKYIYVVIAVVFMIWALSQQANGNAQIWVQVVAVALFFGLMATLMSKTTSNNPSLQNPGEREFDKAIKEDLLEQEEQSNKQSKE